MAGVTVTKVLLQESFVIRYPFLEDGHRRYRIESTWGTFTYDIGQIYETVLDGLDKIR